MSVTVLRAVEPAEPDERELIEAAPEQPRRGRELIAAVAAALRDADRILGVAPRSAPGHFDWTASAGLLDEAAERLSTHMLANGVRAIRVRECAEVLARLHDLRVAVSQAQAERAAERRRAVTLALRGLRGAVTVEQMFKLVPEELCRCGFSRAWLSTVDGGTWQTVSLHTTGGRDPRLERKLAQAGPSALAHGSREAEMVRRRRPVLAGAGTDDGIADPRIAEMFAPTAYVAAPLLVDTRVVAFLHADRPGSGNRIDEDDRELISIFAEAVSYALQRAILSDRLESLRREVRSLTDTVGDLVDRRCCEPVGLAHVSAMACPADSEPAPRECAAPSAASSRLAGLLTARELEVLRLMATGETNAGIAEQLVISQGTVKSHVKNVLRKLHAANRAQAVSRYFRIVRGDGAA